MPLRALVLILIAAVAHSTWNPLAKRAASARHLIWFTSLGEPVLFLPLALRVLRDPAVRFDGPPVATPVATGILHLFYGECLVRGCRIGDLSVVYPVARGTGNFAQHFAEEN